MGVNKMEKENYLKKEKSLYSVEEKSLIELIQLLKEKSDELKKSFQERE